MPWRSTATSGTRTTCSTAIVDVIVGQIERVSPGEDWKAALRDQVMAARAVMLRHPWARQVHRGARHGRRRR